MALERELEMLPAVQRQAHGPTFGIQRSQCHVIREGVVLLLAVAHGESAQIVHLIERKAAGLDHADHMARRGVRCLCGSDHVHHALGALVPGQTVFRLQRCRLHGLAVIVA